jgi:hypothetical protein
MTLGAVISRKGDGLERVSFTRDLRYIPDKDLNSLILIADIHVLEIIQGTVISKSQRSNRLSNVRATNRGGFHFAVKIDFEGESCSIKYRTTILAVTQVALDFASNLGRQPAFQVFAD